MISPRSGDKTDNLFLRTLTICVIPIKMIKAKTDLVSRRIQETGGIVIPFALQGPLDPVVSHYLVDDGLNVEEIFGAFQTASLSPEQILDVFSVKYCMPYKWITSCLQQCAISPESEFHLTRQLQEFGKTKLSPSQMPKQTLCVNDFPDAPAAPITVSTEGPPPVSLAENARRSISERLPSARVKRPRESFPEAFSSYEDSNSDSGDSDDDSSSSENETDASPTRPINKLAAKFVCGHASSSPEKKNLNTHITDSLQKLQKTYDSTGDQWRSMSYQKAINSLRSHPTKISRVEEIKGLKHIGAGIRDKIVEIIETGACEKVAAYCEDNEVNQAISLFCGIHGVSSKTALKWATSKNLRTLDDLRTKDVKLSRVQLIGLKHYHDFLDRIPRDEVTEIENSVREAALRIQDGLELTTCGSYRRGKPTCGDVDILITHPDGRSHRNVFMPLLDSLKGSGFITDELLISEESTQKKFLGVCLLPKVNSKYRRLDIIVVPFNELGCALLYFTGSAHFNRSMRSLAHKDNMALSHHSLNKNATRLGKKKISDGEPIPNLMTEKAVFDCLGLPYRTPEERDH